VLKWQQRCMHCRWVSPGSTLQMAAEWIQCSASVPSELAWLKTDVWWTVPHSCTRQCHALTPTAFHTLSSSVSQHLASMNGLAVFMAALWHRAGHYIFALWFLASIFYLFFPRLIWEPQIGCLPYFHTWCGLSANLECRSEMCGKAYRTQKLAIWASFHNFVGLYLQN